MKQIGSANPFNEVNFKAVVATLFGATYTTFSDFGDCTTLTLIDLNGDGMIDALVGTANGRLISCLNSGNATSPLYLVRTYDGPSFGGIDIRRDDKGGVVTPGSDNTDHSYTKPFAVDIVSLFLARFVYFFKYLFVRN